MKREFPYTQYWASLIVNIFRKCGVFMTVTEWTLIIIITKSPKMSLVFNVTAFLSSRTLFRIPHYFQSPCLRWLLLAVSFFRLSLFLVTLTVFRNTCHILCRKSLSLIVSDGFLVSRLSLWVHGRRPQRYIVSHLPHISQTVNIDSLYWHLSWPPASGSVCQVSPLESWSFFPSLSILYF